MPRGDGTGPLVGPRRGGGGRMTGGGPGGSGTCVCPKCGFQQPHTRGMPCYQLQCPKCGMKMLRGD